jgi:hypothetical protein
MVVVGLLWPWLSKLGLGRLADDIAIERGNVAFYFPIVSASCKGALLKAGPRVRIRLPPAESRANFRFLSGGVGRGAGIAARFTAPAYWKFESIPLQQRVCERSVPEPMTGTFARPMNSAGACYQLRPAPIELPMVALAHAEIAGPGHRGPGRSVCLRAHLRVEERRAPANRAWRRGWGEGSAGAGSTFDPTPIRL